VLINPEGILWLMDEKYPKRFAALGCDVLVVDESTRFKDSRTKRFHAIRKHMYRFKRRYILTGSITPNGIQDLFGQMYILDRGHALGQYVTHFRRKYFSQPNPYEPYKFVPNEGAYNEIIERISPMVIQMQAEDYLEMPELIHREIPIELPPSVRDLYDSVEDDFIALLSDGTPIVAANAAVAGGKCRQIANGAVYFDVEGEREVRYLHQEKVEALKELVEELQGAPLLCLYEFKHDLDQILAAKIDGVEVLTGASPKKAEILVQRFNMGEIKVLLGHPASMGHGLNLQGGCHHVCWYGITWNFEHYDQAIRRVYRQGQENEHVFVYHIVAKETRDAKVYPVLQQKEKTQRDLLNALVEPIGL
jgi:SNF2 family DNA or RNA helicase